MRGVRVWIVVALLAIGVGGAAYLGQPHQDSPEHSSKSDAVNGTSAALLFAQAMGHPTDQMAGSFTPPSSNGIMFIFSPTSPFTSDDAGRAIYWVTSGGVLVYASEQGDPELDRAFQVKRLNGMAAGDTMIANPALQGVNKVAGASIITPLDPGPSQVPIVRTSAGFAVVYREKIGSGTVFVLADPLLLCNGYLEKLDNGVLLSDLLGTTSPAAPVAFDEYHHGLILTDIAPQQWVTTPWGAALLWLIVALFVGLLLRGRTFGPLVPRPTEAVRGETEWAVAVGNLLRRSGARTLTLGLLASASERAVAARTGLPVQPRDRFWNALYGRSPELATELADAERVLYGAAGADADLLTAAQRLHRIAYPDSPQRRP